MHILTSGVRKSHVRVKELVYNGYTLPVTCHNILEVELSELLLTVTEPEVLKRSPLGSTTIAIEKGLLE